MYDNHVLSDDGTIGTFIINTHTATAKQKTTFTNRIAMLTLHAFLGALQLEHWVAV